MDAYAPTFRDLDNFRALRARYRLVEKSLRDHSPHLLPAEALRVYSAYRSLAASLSIGETAPLRLVSPLLNANQSALEWAQGIGLPLAHYPPNHPPALLALLDTLKASASAARVSSCRWRVAEHLRNHPDWYVIFDTLTLDPARCDRSRPGDVLSGDAWKRYKQNFENRVLAASLGTNLKSARSELSKRGMSLLDVVGHFAVLEGLDRNNPHAHVMWFCRDIPPAWKTCPNLNTPDLPRRREISAVKPLWTYGFSAPVALRSSPNDAWGRAGHRWPCDASGNPLSVTGTQSLAGYLTKYLSKARAENEDQQWRTRISRNLGMTRIRKAVKTLPINLLRSLATIKTWRQSIPTQILNTMPPLSLLQRLATEWRFSRLYSKSPKRMLRRLSKPRCPSYSLLADLRQMIESVSSGELTPWLLHSTLETRAPSARRRQDCLIWLMRNLHDPPEQPLPGTTASITNAQL